MNRRRFGAGLSAMVFALFKGDSVEASINEINVADFYLSDGKSGAAIQAAINAAQSNGIRRVRIPTLSTGRYEVDSPIRNDGVELIGDGSETVIFKVGPGSCFLSGHTPKGGMTRLLSDSEPGSTRMDRQSFSSFTFKEGDVFVILSEALCHHNTPAHSGEFITIRSIYDRYVTLDQPLMFGYNIQDGASIIKPEFAEGVAYRQLRIEMDPTVIPPGAMTRFDNYGIQLDFCKQPYLENVSVSQGVAAGLRLLGCLDARVIQYRASNLGSAEEDQTGTSSIDGGGYGYGILERGLNRGLLIEEAVTDRVRHLYSSGAEWPEIFKYGMPTNTLIRNSVSNNAKGACFDTHETGLGITFQGCHARGGQSTGFQIRAKQTHLNDCSVQDVDGAALWFYGANTHENAAGDNCLITNFGCKSTNRALATIHNGKVAWRDKAAIIDQGFNNTFSNIRVDDCGGPGLTVSAEAKGGHYERFTISHACATSELSVPIVDVEQRSAIDPPSFTQFRVIATDRARMSLRVVNANCKPIIVGGNLE